jgi:hypothetical protein
LTTDPGIFPQGIYSAEFSMDGMLRADAGARAAYYKTMTDIQAITPNEIRHLENLPPLPDGDKVKIPTSERISVAEPQAPDTNPPTVPPVVPGAKPAMPAQMAAANGAPSQGHG